ncbi:MAG TPA: hypothetical protein VGO50_03205 [Pyrinomonadaceae bacterium]|jgi:hypothetical protein|nr:hypothetical protein [Pyrinomonadaceae bacterium]
MNAPNNKILVLIVEDREQHMAHMLEAINKHMPNIEVSPKMPELSTFPEDDDLDYQRPLVRAILGKKFKTVIDKYSHAKVFIVDVSLNMSGENDTTGILFYKELSKDPRTKRTPKIVVSQYPHASLTRQLKGLDVDFIFKQDYDHFENEVVYRIKKLIEKGRV